MSCFTILPVQQARLQMFRCFSIQMAACTAAHTSTATNSDGVFYRLSAGLHAFVSLMTLSGKAGQTVEILGQGLTGTTSVKFGSGAATFTVVSDTYMTAVVPGTGATGN